MKKLVALISTLVLSLSLFTACGGSEVTYTPGTYTVQTKGYNDMIIIVLIEEETRIHEVIVNHEETPGIGAEVVDDYIKQVMETQNLELDTVAGATLTCEALVNGTKEAVAQATAK